MGNRLVIGRDLPLLVGTLAAAHQFEAAEHQANAIKPANTRALAYALLADAVAFFGDAAGAITIIDKTETALEEIDNERSREQIVRWLALARIRVGRESGIDGLTDPFARASAYARVGHVLLDVRDNAGTKRCR